MNYLLHSLGAAVGELLDHAVAKEDLPLLAELLVAVDQLSEARVADALLLAVRS